MDKQDVKKNAPRYGAMSLELSGGTGGIVSMCPCSSFMEVYKIDKTFQIQTPENLDPQEIDPNMGWVVKEKDNIGSNNKIIARLIIQSEEFVKLLPSSINQEEVRDKLHQCKELLVACQRIALEINSEVVSINKQVDDNALSIKHRVINPFPQVKDLEKNSSDFLKDSKMFIQTLVEIFNHLFEEKVEGPRFNEVRNALLKKFGEGNILYEYIARNEPYVHNIVYSRNKIEHPSKNKKFIINNYTLLPQNQICPPVWFLTGQEPRPISERMNQLVDDLLAFAEEFFILCVFEKKDDWIPYMIIEIPESERRTECPIRYEPQIDGNKLFQQKTSE
ncbi:MAG: hypothetical protein ACRC7I_10985 [Selenomonadaceae bacterium]